MSKRILFSVFTKPWPRLRAEELGQFIRGMGFDGIEFPLRPGYQVEPQNAEKGLPDLARRLSECGVRLTSVAGPLVEATFAGCAAAGVRVLRHVQSVGEDGYLATEARLCQQLEGLVPLCERYGVRIALQTHSGTYVAPNALGMRRIMDHFDPHYIGTAWDACHTALNGEEPEIGLQIIWSHLAMVILQNAYWRRANGPECETVQWQRYLTSGRQGIASWPRVLNYLKKRGYEGIVCLGANYDARDQTDRLVAEDLTYAKSLLECP